jgi:hypothetical protein
MKAATIATILIAFLLSSSVAMTEIDVSLETYDRNNDGVIDEVERLTLDIDIENSRIRIDESMFEGGYTTTGSLILTDEFKAFAFGDSQIGAVPIEDPSPSIEPKMGIIADVKTVEPRPQPTEDEKDDTVVTADLPPAKSNLTGILGGSALCLVIFTGVYFYYRKDRPEKDDDPDDE